MDKLSPVPILRVCRSNSFLVITFSKRASGYETIIAGFFRELIRFKTSDLNKMLALSVSSI